MPRRYTSPAARLRRTQKSASGSEFLRQITHAVAELRSDVGGHTKLLKRIEAKVTHTNGRVQDLEKWQIQQETEESVRKELNDSATTNYRGPIVSGVVVGVILVVFQLVIHTV